MQILFSPIQSWLSLALLASALTAEIVLSYRGKTARTGRGPLVLRLLSALLIVLLMLRPSLEFTQTESTEAVLLIAADASPSMQTRDAAGASSRRQALLDLLTENAPRWKKLAEKTEIVRFDYADRIEPVEEFSDRVQGEQTSIVHSLEELLHEIGDRRSVGLFFLGDGAQRAFAPLNGDPRNVALQFGERKIPIYAVPFGATGFSESALDLAIEELLIDPLAFEGTTVPVTVRLRAIGASGKTVRLRILMEDRRGLPQGVAGELRDVPGDSVSQPVREVTIQGANQLIPVDLSFVPRESGEFKLRVEVETLDREVKTTNNSRDTILTVRKGGIRVALLYPIPAEQKFLRRLNRSEQIQLDFHLVLLGDAKNRVPLSDELFEPGRYDAYILGEVPAEAFTRKQLTALWERVNRDGAGLMMLGGVRSFGPGGYAATPLDELLPVRMEESETMREGRVDPALRHLREMRIQPTNRGRTHYLMQLGSDRDSSETWRRLPPLHEANRLVPKNVAVEVLAESEDGTPLLLAHEVGRARVLAFAGNSTWQWCMHGFTDEYLRFWQQVILWLSRKELEGDQTVWVRVQPRTFGRGQRVPLEFGARDEQGAPLTGVAFQVEVVAPDGTTTSLPAQSLGGVDAAEFTQTETPGDYWVRVKAEKEGQPIGPTAWTRFLVNAGDLELDNPAADPALMEDLARLSGGSVILPDRLEETLDQLLGRGLKSLDLREVRRISLWDNPWVLLAFVALLTGEWFWRKRRGLV